MGLYSRYILPNIISCACSAPAIASQRRKVVPRAEGVVLELGFGSGHNLPFYRPARVSMVYALEPEPGMLAKAQRNARHAPVPVTVLPEKAEEVSLPDASVDTVLVTYAMCTIPDVITALSGARRVLKPGGRLLFCEHGRAPDPEVARTQERIEPAWRQVFGGCHLTRDIPRLVEAAGFAVTDLDTLYLRKTPRFAGYTYRGQAAALA